MDMPDRESSSDPTRRDDARYWESTSAGRGTRTPRADALGTARRILLNGVWRFRLSPTAAGTGDTLTSDDLDDTGWDRIRVPSHWVLEEVTAPGEDAPRSLRGTPDGPLYTNTAYPIPLDPPRVTADNPTGDYRVAFDVPDDWQSAVLRFQGVDSCAKVWLNGRELGWWQGSRLPVEFDAPVRPGTNILAVRVHRWSSGTYLEDQDMWWLPGIFRDVELIERPDGAIDDHVVHADYDAATGIGTLRVEASTAAVVEIPELGIRMAAGEEAAMPVQPWSADRPRLYRGTLRSAGEVVELAIGFRRVGIVDGVLTVNGRALTFHGVNRHEHHPDKGRALDRETMVRDIVMMKRANIDAVRTSHYPPHPDFLRLCDEYGLWVVEECDIETHGFVYAGWAGNPPGDPAWCENLLTRVQRMVERDKNRPSVVVWSLANESGSGEAFRDLRAWIADRDPSRPVLYERDPGYRDSDFYSLMYPPLEDLERIGRREEDRPAATPPEDDARRRALPFLLVEYAHAMGNGPGSLQDYQRIIDAHPRICGGFVWEWIDHGFHALAAEGTPIILQSEDIDYEPRGGRFTLHGLVFSDRTPTPGLVELAKAYEPVRIEVGEQVRIRNRRHAADTADLRFTWQVDVEGERVDGGSLPVPPLAAGEVVDVALPPAAATAAGDRFVVTVAAETVADALWAPAGHVVAWGQGVAPAAAESAPPDMSSPRASAAPAGHRSAARGPIVLGTACFDPATGRLQSLGGVDVDGPWLDLHRAPTENDHGQGDLNDLAAVWHRTGIDRLLHRMESVEHGDDRLRVAGRTAPATQPFGAEWTMLWQIDARGLRLDVDVDFTGPWADTPYQHHDVWVPRLGLLLSLPGAYRRARWFGRGPGETYADSFEGSPIGRFDRAIDDLQTPYPVPQENGNHVGTRWLELTGDGVPRLRAEGLPEFDFTARRWTSHALQRAEKPHALRDSGRVWLNLDHGQQGIGSASVGPALPEEYRIPRRRTAWSVRLQVE